MSLSRSIKELVRKVSFLWMGGRKLDHLAGDRRTNFSIIYERKLWTHGDEQVPLSGLGSSLEATASLRRSFPEILRKINTRTLLDIGCGDFTWMQAVELPCAYYGIDIVESVIEANQQIFASPVRQFYVVDAVLEIPCPADTVLCREVLFHLSFADGIAVLKNSLIMGCEWLLLTSDGSTSINADIESGDFRVLNLRKHPFNLPEPIYKIDDSAVLEKRMTGVWTAHQVMKALR